MKYSFTQNEIDIFKTLGTIICSGEKTYMFLPFWIERDSEQNFYRMHKLGNLPTELKDLIKDLRIVEKI